MTRDGARFAQRFFEGVEESFAQHAQGDIRRRAVHAGFRLAVTDKMFQRGQDVALVAKLAIALEPTNRGNAQARDQVRILAVGFFDAAPARFARDIDHGRKGLMRAAAAGFERRHGEEAIRPTQD